ncbi:hypothetical protein PR048_013132 [Dryococelus australis]|uniref:Uncharacterized protein n=1 Tax=Dryococelus australis TaxID=614101 RepID=A0ABQ9HRA4_9NEOP|nr:hypothetical protein PR048_013132 [Dryococelus australis]
MGSWSKWSRWSSEAGGAVKQEEQVDQVEQVEQWSRCSIWREYKRKNATMCSNLVKQILYKPPVITVPMEYCRRNEYGAIRWFEKETGLCIQQCGLFVDLHHGFFGSQSRLLCGRRQYS